MLSWPTSVAGKHDKLSHFMGHISAVLAAIFWSRAHTDSRSLSRSAKCWKLLSSSLAYFRDQNPKPGNDKVSASGFSLNGEKKSSRNWGWLGLSFIVSMGGDSWKKKWKKFLFILFFKHCDTLCNSVNFWRKMRSCLSIAARISSFPRGKN